MYDKAVVGTGGVSAGTLPVTGPGALFWLLLAAFALLALGGALRRIAPKTVRRPYRPAPTFARTRIGRHIAR